MAAQNSAQTLIRVENLFKLFGKKPEKFMSRVHQGESKDKILSETGHTLGLQNINLEINKGEVFVIMGLSGSGKSTLIRHFNRLIEPTEGRIYIDHTDVTALKPKALQYFRRNRVSMVFQHFALMPHLTVIENVSYGLAVQGISTKERFAKADEWLQAVGLTGYDSQYPWQLSGGQQQRVGLARALCTDADILLLDEAFSALDPLIRNAMQDQLIELQKQLHKTIIFITHDLNEALRLGDRVAILKDGAVVQIDKPVDILLKPVNDYVKAFVKDVNLTRVLTAADVMEPPATSIVAKTQAEAFKQMRQQPNEHSFYLTAEGFEGILHQQKGLKATKSDNNPQEIELLQDPSWLPPDAILEVVLPLLLEANYPLPVIDAKGVLLGEVSRVSLAKVLASTKSRK